MKNIDDVVNLKKCSGCEACANICPHGAISMQSDDEGFLVPVVDDKKCVGCGLCDRVCPALNEVSRKSQFSIPKVYAGWNKNEKIRMKSSSGGVFTVLAEYFLKKKGYVCGAAFDVKNHLRHIIVSNKKDLEKLRGSKYVQSEIGDVYKKIKVLLDKNKWVLFSGTPCQAAGLKNFLRKDYEKLLVVDLVCHGVPSPLVFKEYIKEAKNIYKTKINNVEFRNKSFGWRNPHFVIKNEKDEVLIKKVLYDDTYGRGFLTNLYLRPICAECIYTGVPRIADISLGDFWGIWNYKEDLNDNKGTSLVLINNLKGEKLFNEIKRNILKCEEVPLKVAVENNYPVFISSDAHVNRRDFFDEFKKGVGNISDLILKYLDDQNYGVKLKEGVVGLLNFHYENFNFGANLVSYSLSRVIEKLGFRVKTINYNPFPEQSVLDKACSLCFYKFKQKFLPLTKVCKNDSDLIKLNNQFDNFVVGSDQVWRQLITNKNALHYFLDFADSSKNIISYGASFGHNYWDGDEETTKGARELLKRFNAVSVREKDGINILLDTFGIKNATCVLDPTLLLNKKDYELLIKSECIPKIRERYIAYYFLFDNDGLIEHGEKMSEISKYMECKVINIRGEKKIVVDEEKFVFNSIPVWLNYMKNCECIVTDSFHGVVFAILFKKNFICVGKNSKVVSRFENLFSTLKIDIKDRFLASLEEIKNNEIFLKKINYKDVYKRLNLERKKSIDFLKRNLKTKISLDDILKNLQRELIETKIINLDFETFNRSIQAELQTKISELETKNISQIYSSDLNNQLKNLEEQKDILNNKLQEMEINNKTLQKELKQLDLAIKAYQKTKTYRYAKKIKKILLKLGVKKFKL